ncbi:carboxypeptidase-like regulatory domain-containing protein [Fulvivirga ligni]|uniref:carboxypeptidase-like regulatory domain-containing protein n=1 Tax=Fulvivirga ligni TaxID=2904246 RepID=UPI001F1EBFB3|nr:carboxypeptidase-like regulatory domain-containing protein [Fulvivirga ligni]UII20199.1 carboxypeptidase-like regulatory domain-containing protein [Fulvivirga ligni]
MKPLLTVFLISLSTIVLAQQTAIDSKIIDQETLYPVPYATVQIKNFLTGTVANENGDFSFMADQADSIKISCIGYESLILAVSDIADSISLQPKAIILSDVYVFDKMPNAKNIVRKAFKSIKKNFISDPFTMKTFYRHYCKDDSIYGRLIEAAVDVYKPKGYKKTSDFEELNRDKRKLHQLRRSFDQSALAQFNHVPIAYDRVLSYDLAAYQDMDDEEHFLPIFGSQSNLKRKMKEYSFKLKGISNYDGHEVYVIDYTSKKWEETLSTGIKLNVTHKGQLHIRSDNYAFIKSETFLEVQNFQTIKTTVTYQESNGQYYLAHAVYEQQSHGRKTIPPHNAHIEILVNQVKLGKDKAFKDEPMTEKVLAETRYDPQFWKNYTVIVENPLEKRIREHLERNETLTEQYVEKAEKEGKSWEMLANDQKALEDIINNPNGKIYYIDFWASWCAPCISEFIKSNKTVEKYKLEGVEFLYVSIDAGSDNWSIMKERYGLSNEKHLRIGNEEEIIKKYEATSIPHYIMVLPNGSLLKDAPRPSSIEFVELIEREIRKWNKSN